MRRSTVHGRCCDLMALDSISTSLGSKPCWDTALSFWARHFMKGYLQTVGLTCPGVGDGVLPKELGRGVRPTSQNPYPIIYDQNLQFSLPIYANVS